MINVAWMKEGKHAPVIHGDEWKLGSVCLIHAVWMEIGKYVPITHAIQMGTTPIHGGRFL